MEDSCQSQRTRPINILFLMLFCAVLFFVNTWGYDLWPPDEPRFAQVAREMMQSGDLLVPQINNQPYKEKPPLLFWAISAVSLPFGDVTEFSARAPSGIAAIVAVLFTYLLATRLYNRLTGYWAGLILATMALFLWEARSSRTDMLLTASMSGAFYFFWRWHEARQVRWQAALYGAIAVGLFAKGPPALVFPVLLFVFFYWPPRRAPRGRRWLTFPFLIGPPNEERQNLHWFGGLLSAMLLVLCWYVPSRMAASPAVAEHVQGGLGAELVRQTVGRFLLGGSKAAWPWMYLQNLPMDLLPWTIFLPWMVVWVWRRRHEDERMRLLLAWTVPAFVFFSICIGKRDIYLLPIYPALAILFARGIFELGDGAHPVWLKRTRLVYGFALLVIAFASIGLYFSQYKSLLARTYPFFIAALISGVMALAWDRIYGVLVGRAGSLQPEMRRLSLPTLIVSTFMLLVVFAACYVFPAVNAFKGASDFCRPLRVLTETGMDYRLFTVGFSREEYIYYTKHAHTPLLTDLLPVKLPHEMSFTKMAKGQIALRKAIAKAVDKVPVAQLTAPTDAEVQSLRAAVHGAVADAKVDRELALAFENALTETIASIAADFDESAPAFMFIQEEDWKWLLPLFPNLARHKIIGKEAVGRRHMLLVANQAGEEAVGAK